MSWISMLAKTYDNCSHLWGKREDGDPMNSIPLLMVGQSTQNAHIEVTLDENADIISAHVISAKPERTTVIPCTEQSIGRSGRALYPHPLHDKLQYIAKDYQTYGGTKNPGWVVYMENLNDWCASPFVHPKVKIIRDYLKRGTLIKDLVSRQVMLTENGKLIEEPTKQQKEAFPLLQISGLTQSEAFVRFKVSLPGDLVSEPWLDQSVTDSFNAWQASLRQNVGLCYVTGQNKSLSTNHPAKIRHSGDSAKLISANDSSGFTYRGRFTDETEVVGVGYETSQKAHNMLKWLISRRGFRNDSQVFVAWGTKIQPLPKLSDDTADLFSLDEEPDDKEDEAMDNLYRQNMRGEYAQRLRRSMAGYGSNIHDTDNVVVMGVDSATPGRMSIIFYREIAGTDFLDRIESWHSRCSWLHTYKFRDKKRVPFFGAPGPRDIALAAYGSNAADNLIKSTVERLLRCIVDGKPIPPEIRESLVRRAGNPVALDNWEWQKTLSIACAIVRKHLLDTKGGEWNMAMDECNHDRSYLFGRLLAYAQHMESYSQWKGENTHRQTNAERMMHQFSLRPAKTWAQLALRLQSYLRQLKNPRLVDWWNVKTCEILDMLGKEGYTNKPLGEQYLLGYSSQILALRNNMKEKETKEEDDNGTEE